jgi:hypothetical protein
MPCADAKAAHSVLPIDAPGRRRCAVRRGTLPAHRLPGSPADRASECGRTECRKKREADRRSEPRGDDNRVWDESFRRDLLVARRCRRRFRRRRGDGGHDRRNGCNQFRVLRRGRRCRHSGHDSGRGLGRGRRCRREWRFGRLAHGDDGVDDGSGRGDDRCVIRDRPGWRFGSARRDGFNESGNVGHVLRRRRACRFASSYLRALVGRRLSRNRLDGLGGGRGRRGIGRRRACRRRRERGRDVGRRILRACEGRRRDGGGEQRERVDVPLRISRVPDAEVDVRLVDVGLAARPDGAHDGPFEDRRVALRVDRSEMDERHRVPVLCLNRHGLAALRHRSGE